MLYLPIMCTVRYTEQTVECSLDLILYFMLFGFIVSVLCRG